MTAILVDDERLARKELRRLLLKHPQVEVVGEAANADQARVLLSELHPDLVFLDVQMPGESGFDFLMKLDSIPGVIFTTAFDQFAVKAFEFGAYDYLLKPVEPHRLAASLGRISDRESFRTPGSCSAEDILRESDQVFVRDGEGTTGRDSVAGVGRKLYSHPL